MRANARASEGRIYISIAQSTFRERGSEGKTEIIFECLKMYGVCRTKDGDCMWILIQRNGDAEQVTA